jgi:hypothetical protein
MYRLAGVSIAAGTITDIQNAEAKKLAPCALENKLKECTASRSNYKCINCVTLNARSKDKKTNETHPSLDWNGPSLQAMILNTGRILTNNMVQTVSNSKSITQGHKNTSTLTTIT